MKVTAIFCGRTNWKTECVAKAALTGAAEEGAEVEAINLMDLTIQPCINCGSCVRVLSDDTYHGRCPFEGDDITWLDGQILDSDGLIFVAPMFEKAAPATYKMMCDRMGPSHDVTFRRFAYDRRMARGEDPRIDPRWFVSRPVSFIGHGGSEWSHLSYPSLSSPAISMGLDIVDRLQMDWNADLLFREDRMERIRESGRHVARMAGLEPGERTYIGAPGYCPICHNDVMRLDEEGDGVSCAVCGVHGTIAVADGRITVTYTQEALEKSHLRESGRRIHLADLQHNGKANGTHTPQEWADQKRLLCGGISTTKPSRA